jgi:hypothetical protein
MYQIVIIGAWIGLMLYLVTAYISLGRILAKLYEMKRLQEEWNREHDRET